MKVKKQNRKRMKIESRKRSKTSKQNTIQPRLLKSLPRKPTRKPKMIWLRLSTISTHSMDKMPLKFKRLQMTLKMKLTESNQSGIKLMVNTNNWPATGTVLMKKESKINQKRNEKKDKAEKTLSRTQKRSSLTGKMEKRPNGTLISLSLKLMFSQPLDTMQTNLKKIPHQK